MNSKIEEHQRLVSKLKYQNIFENIPIGIIYFDTKGIVTDSNNYATDIFGRTKEEFLGLNLLKSLKNQQLIQAVRDVLTRGDATYEGNYQPINGHKSSYLDITFQAIYSDAGIITAAVGLVKDITNEKKAQVSLNHYKHILDATTDMMAYIDNDYRYIACNKAYLDFHKKGAEDITDKKVSDVIGQENFSHIKDLLDRALEGEKFIIKGSYQQPNTDDIIYDEIYEEGSFAPYINDKGEITGVVVAIRDITTQELTKKKMHQSIKQTKLYFDILPVMILALDQGANIIRINQRGCDLLGYTQEELLGRNWIDTCIPEEIQNSIHLAFSEMMIKKSGFKQQHKNEIIAKNGEKRLILWNNILIKDNDGYIIEILSAGEDITERNKTT